MCVLVREHPYYNKKSLSITYDEVQVAHVDLQKSIPIQSQVAYFSNLSIFHTCIADRSQSNIFSSKDTPRYMLEIRTPK